MPDEPIIENQNLIQVREHAKQLEADLKVQKDLAEQKAAELEALKTTVTELTAKAKEADAAADTRTENEKLKNQIDEIQSKITELEVYKNKAETYEQSMKTAYEKLVESLPEAKRDAAKFLTLNEADYASSVAKLNAFIALIPAAPTRPGQPVDSHLPSGSGNGKEPVKLDLKNPSTFKPVLSRPTEEQKFD